MAGSMRSTLCALLFRFAIFLVFACRERSSASKAASHDALTAADPQTCFRPEPCGSARESATALGLAIRLTVGAAADLQQSTPTRHQDPFVHHIGYPTSCVSVSTLLHALRCFASQGHSSESSHWSKWNSFDARFRQCGLGSFMLRTVSVLSWFVVSHKNIYSGISVACGALEYLTAPLCRYKGSDDPSWRFAWVRGVTST